MLNIFVVFMTQNLGQQYKAPCPPISFTGHHIRLFRLYTTNEVEKVLLNNKKKGGTEKAHGSAVTLHEFPISLA
jgi:hypothetical protein